MTATLQTTANVHEPWCTAHVDPNPAEGLREGWCADATTVTEVEVGLSTCAGFAGVEVYSPGERMLTPQEARVVAAEIIRASLVAEGKGGSGAVLAANVVRLIAEATPLDTDALEVLADQLEVSVVSLLV